MIPRRSNGYVKLSWLDKGVFARRRRLLCWVFSIGLVWYKVRCLVQALITVGGTLNYV